MYFNLFVVYYLFTCFLEYIYIFKKKAKQQATVASEETTVAGEEEASGAAKAVEEAD